MKKYLSLLAGTVFFSLCLGVTTASSLSPMLRIKIDTVLGGSAQTAQLFLEKIGTIEERYTPGSDAYTLLTDLKEYLEEKREAYTPYEIGSHIGQSIPQGYGRLSHRDLIAMQEVFHLVGPGDAPIWIIEFVDFQCPYCQRQSNRGVVEQLRDIEFPGKVRSAIGMFPLGGKRHELAQQAAESAECVYQYTDAETYEAYAKQLFARGLQPTRSAIRTVTKQVGADATQVDTCIDEGFATTNVSLQKNQGIRLGARGTPATAIIDSRTGAYTMIGGAVPVEQFYPVVKNLRNALKQ